jgi:hypothetical protein
MGGAIQPSTHSDGSADLYDVAKPHLQFPGHADQTVGKHAAGHCRIEQYGSEAAVQCVGKALEAALAGKGRFHLTLRIHLEVEFQTIAVFPSTGDTTAVQGCSSRVEIPAHCLDG